MSDIVFNENGLTVATQAEMLDTLKSVLRGKLGDAIIVDDPDGNLGRIAQILNEMKSDLAGHLLAANSALLPSTSTGQILRELVKFNGITANEQTYSSVVLTCTANAAGATILAGSLVATTAGVTFATDSETVLSPTETLTDVNATAVEPGAVTAEAGTVTEILTPVYGWETVTNAAAAIPGAAAESDPALRARRWAAAVGVGLHHPSKIKTALKNLDDVTDAYVEINNTTSTNAHGVPPGFVRAIVRGGADADIAATLFGSYAPYAGAGSVAAGVSTYGNELVHVVDAVSVQEGDIYFDRSTDKNIYVRVVTTKIAGKYPANGDTLIKQYILELFAGDLEIEGGMVDGAELGADVYGTDIMAACKAVPGHKLTAVYVGFAAVPTTTSVSLDVNEFPVTAENLITINGA